MLRIDAHQHFWKYHPVRDSWITEKMTIIRKDFLPEDLQPFLQQSKMDGCVAVQADQSEEENGFLLSLAAQYDFIKGIVGWVDLRADNTEERLAYYQQFKKLKGFRHILQGEADRALMLQPFFMRGIAALQSYNFTYDILIFPDQLQYAKELVARFPQQKFVIDHIAKPYIKSKRIEDWKKDMQAIAPYQNVYCKISGIVTEGDWKGWKEKDFYPYLDVVVEAFGMSRIMFGSDWPVCLVAASYEQMISIVKNYFSSFSAHEQALFFGGNAVQFYHLT